MPTYQYVCTACDSPHEAVQSFSDPALTDCPACAGRLRKVYGAVGVVFKGSGFYKNDSRKETKQSSPSTEGSPAPAAADGGSKPAAPAPAASSPAPSTPAASGSTSSAPASKTA